MLCSFGGQRLCRVKEEVHSSTPKSSIFWVPSQNCQHFCEKIICECCGKMSEKFKNCINILVRPVVLELLCKICKNIILIHNSRTGWSANLLMSSLTLSGNLLQGTHITFHTSVDNFVTAHRTCSILVWFSSPLKTL